MITLAQSNSIETLFNCQRRQKTILGILKLLFLFAFYENTFFLGSNFITKIFEQNICSKYLFIQIFGFFKYNIDDVKASQPTNH